MILVDANLLVYAYAREMPQHETARTWLDSRLSGPAKVGLPWSSLLAFVRLVSNPRIFEKAVPIPEAWRQVESWLGSGRAWIPQPTEQHASLLHDLMPQIGGRSNLIPDAHLAALAIEHGLTLHSCDGDFARFRGLSWENPLRGTAEK